MTDTVALIWYYADVFGQTSGLSSSATRVFDEAIRKQNPFVRLIVPAVFFIEIFEKWLTSEAFAKRFYFDVYLELAKSDSVAIRELDQEVLVQLLAIGGSLNKHEINDKLILASAMVLACPLITSDTKIADFVAETGAIPDVIR